MLKKKGVFGGPLPSSRSIRSAQGTQRSHAKSGGGTTRRSKKPYPDPEHFKNAQGTVVFSNVMGGYGGNVGPYAIVSQFAYAGKGLERPPSPSYVNLPAAKTPGKIVKKDPLKSEKKNGGEKKAVKSWVHGEDMTPTAACST